MAAMVKLEPMAPDVFVRWRAGAVRTYADDKVRAGTWTEDEALARSERAFAQLLPAGLATPGHGICSMVAEGGEIVGMLWYGPIDGLRPGTCYIWDIEVAEEARGRGFGRAALQALEPIARGLGYDAIALHVFGDNEVARNLYRTSGYIETDVMMRKEL
jgi:ribosomal protein S18 acetylase RimI-like enzyme